MLRLVKIPILLIVTTLLIASVLSFRGNYATKTAAEKIKDNYVESLIILQNDLTDLSAALQEKKESSVIRKQFLHCRLVYKKIAFLVDLFNPYEARLLNGPALQRTEEDNPQTIVDPEGFQVLEELLFETTNDDTWSKAIVSVNKLKSVFKKLQDDPDLAYKFHDAQLFQAMQNAIVRLAAMGLSGFDSPVALYSIPEAISTLEGLKASMQAYEPLFSDKKKKDLYQQFVGTIGTAKSDLTGKTFLSFDRALFLKTRLAPIYGQLIIIRDELKIERPQGRLPVNPAATSFFDANFFTIDFFSPNSLFRITDDRVALGKKLFYDPVLSGEGNRSCATCHQPGLAFTDGVPKALAVDGKTFVNRNTPTLWNSVFQTRQFYDSRTVTLENQLSDVVHNTREMKGSLQNNIPQLKNDAAYTRLFDKAYPEEKEKITQYNISNAIASYIRSLVALNSRFDQYMRGDETKMSAIEIKGFNVFMSKGKCGTCHYLPLFNGLVPPDFNETESEVLGVPDNAKKKNARLDSDEGKFNFTRSIVHKHAFKTQGLRNIELTAPYMHNGVFKTLEQVVDFYNDGGGTGWRISPPNQTLPAEKLHLTNAEKKALIAFMKTLTDTSAGK